MKYLYSATGPDGRRVVDYAEAETADDALADLRADGMEAVRLHFNDLLAAAAELSGSTQLAPRALLRLMDGGPPAVLWFKVKFFYRTYWGAFLGLAAVVVVRQLFGSPLGWPDAVVLAVGLAPAGLLAVTELAAGAWAHRRMNEALAWGRFADVLHYASMLKGTWLAFELDMFRAAALRGVGRPEAARKILDGLKEQVERGELRPELRLVAEAVAASWSDAPRETVPIIAEVVELFPHNGTARLDAAAGALLYDRDAVRGRSLLAEAERHALSDWDLVLVPGVRGLLALEEGRADEAAALFAEARQRLLAAKNRNYASATAYADVFRAYLAAAEAARGNDRDARRHFRAAEPRLAALKWHHVLDRCRPA